MKFPRVFTTTEKAFLIYHSCPHFRKSDLMNLFGCCSSTALKMSRIVRSQMQAKGVRLYCQHNELLDKDIVFDLAGLNIEQVNRDYKMLQKFNKVSS